MQIFNFYQKRKRVIGIAFALDLASIFSKFLFDCTSEQTKKETVSVTVRYVTPTNRIREQILSAHLLYCSFLFFKLSLGFRIDFKFR